MALALAAFVLCLLDAGAGAPAEPPALRPARVAERGVPGRPRTARGRCCWWPISTRVAPASCTGPGSGASTPASPGRAGSSAARCSRSRGCSAAVLACAVARLAGVDGVALTAVQFALAVALVAALALLVDIWLSPTVPGRRRQRVGRGRWRCAWRSGSAARSSTSACTVLLTGAQESGGPDGMRAFLRRHRRELPRDSTVVLNLDEVGSGSVRFTSREGPLLAARSHVQLTGLCEEIAAGGRRPSARQPRGQRRLRRALRGLSRDHRHLPRRARPGPAAPPPQRPARARGPGGAGGGGGVLRGAGRAPRRARGPGASEALAARGGAAARRRSRAPRDWPASRGWPPARGRRPSGSS